MLNRGNMPGYPANGTRGNQPQELDQTDPRGPSIAGRARVFHLFLHRELFGNDCDKQENIFQVGVAAPPKAGLCSSLPRVAGRGWGNNGVRGMSMYKMIGQILSCLIVFTHTGARADLFGSGTNQFNIDFVPIGHAGNAADATGYGAVGYNYRIGKTEVSIDQFFKARAADGRIGNGNENYWNDGFRTVGLDAPASAVDWFEAAMFCNWLTTGDAYTGVYQFNGSGTLVALDRTYRNGNGLAYVLPSEDEWYKAAYFKADGSGYSLYASGLGTVPIHGTVNGWNYYSGGYVNEHPNDTWVVGFGAEEQNGTHDMMGNLLEWSESAVDGTLDDLQESRTIRGGEYGNDEFELSSEFRLNGTPEVDKLNRGFRVAVIPEPSSVLLLTIGAGALLFQRRAVRRRFDRPASRNRFP